jgi:hypothetical protein
MNERGLHSGPLVIRNPSTVTDVTSTIAGSAYTGKTRNILMSDPSEDVHVSICAESTADAAVAQVLPSLSAREHVAVVHALPLLTLAPASTVPLAD